MFFGVYFSSPLANLLCPTTGVLRAIGLAAGRAAADASVGFSGVRSLCDVCAESARYGVYAEVGARIGVSARDGFRGEVGDGAAVSGVSCEWVSLEAAMLLIAAPLLKEEESDSCEPGVL